MRKNIIFFNEELNIRAGGPSGYLANLQEGLEEIDSPIKIISKKDIIFRKNYLNKNLLKKSILFLVKLLPIKKLRTFFRKEIKNKAQQNIPTDNFLKNIMSYETITCHSIYDVKLLKDYIVKYNLNNKIIFMSHSPELPSVEAYSFEIEAGLDKRIALKNKRNNEMLERRAFNASDYMIFPSKEAMEPYKETMEDFDIFLKNKEILFIRTGCKKLTTHLTREEILEKYNIPAGKKNICYIGRHSFVKGYDSLKDIAKAVLKKEKNCQFIIGGKLGSEIKPLSHDRWLEIGFVNPAEILKITDLFILPNKRTYFDLILLEVLSSGTFCLASKTGGNKTVFNETQSISLYEDIDSAVEKVLSILDIEDIEMKKLNDKAYGAFLKKYTLKKFAKNYEKTISGI